MTLPMASVVLADPPSLDEQAARATWTALCALGDLTTLANSASSLDEALKLRALGNEVLQAALGAIGVAMDLADRLGERREAS